MTTNTPMALAAARYTILDQPAFNRNRLNAEKLIDSKVLEQLIRVQMDAGALGLRRGREQIADVHAIERHVAEEMAALVAFRG